MQNQACLLAQVGKSLSFLIEFKFQLLSRLCLLQALSFASRGHQVAFVEMVQNQYGVQVFLLLPLSFLAFDF
jgi:hypothetical protein